MIKAFTPTADKTPYGGGMACVNELPWVCNTIIREDRYLPVRRWSGGGAG